MKNLIWIFCLIGLAAAISCSEDNILEVPDPSIQRAADIALIDDYLAENGFTEVDTTESGVRYVIVEEGTGDAIDESDNVTFNYTGKLLSDTIFDSSIKLVVDSIRAAVSEDSVGLEDKSVHRSILLSFPELDQDRPFDITYTATGWSFEDSFITGFSDGILASFDSRKTNSVKIGGKVLIAVPSDIAYGTVGSGYFIGPNTPILFELYPVKVEKQ